MSEPRPKTLPAFVVGHSVRTTNAAEADPSTAMLPGLWAHVTGDADLLSNPARADDALYAVLLDYESDETGAYTQVVGIGVDEPASLPHDLVAVRVSDVGRHPYLAEGEMPRALIAAWEQVWADTAAGKLRRAFTCDIEVHATDGSATILVATV